MSPIRGAAEALETGRWRGPVARTAASVWSVVAARSIVRPGELPRRVAGVCVGGATLGGSGKTRVAIACARLLASFGVRVVLVGHAHRARPGRARRVSGDDPLGEVGDEAIVCARALSGRGAAVVVAPTRQSAIDAALSLSPDVLVLDGPLALSSGAPDGAALSLLAVDARAPWGSGHVPPAGDLRAPRRALLARADHVVPVDATPARIRWPDGAASSLEALRGREVGLFTALARPQRLVASLAAAGVELESIVSVADHGPLSRAGAAALARSRAAVWLATDKCALHLDRAAPRGAIVILEGDVTLPPPVVAALERLATGCRSDGRSHKPASARA